MGLVKAKLIHEFYEVTDTGEVRSLARTVTRANGRSFRVNPRTLRPSNVRGYRQVQLWRDGKMSCHYVHRLVWVAFVGPIPEGYEINHLNGDTSDNRLANLECVTHSENMRHAVHVIKTVDPRKASDNSPVIKR